MTTPRFVVARDELETSAICLQPLASAGLDSAELDVALAAISTACDQEDMSFDIDQSNFQSLASGVGNTGFVTRGIGESHTRNPHDKWSITGKRGNDGRG